MRASFGAGIQPAAEAEEDVADDAEEREGEGEEGDGVVGVGGDAGLDGVGEETHGGDQGGDGENARGNPVMRPLLAMRLASPAADRPGRPRRRPRWSAAAGHRCRLRWYKANGATSESCSRHAVEMIDLVLDDASVPPLRSHRHGLAPLVESAHAHASCRARGSIARYREAAFKKHPCLRRALLHHGIDQHLKWNRRPLISASNVAGSSFCSSAGSSSTEQLQALPDLRHGEADARCLPHRLAHLLDEALYASRHDIVRAQRTGNPAKDRIAGRQWQVACRCSSGPCQTIPARVTDVTEPPSRVW